MSYLKLVLQNHCPFCGNENGTGLYCEDCFEIIGDMIPAHIDLVKYEIQSIDFETTLYHRKLRQKAINSFNRTIARFEVGELKNEIKKQEEKYLNLQKSSAEYIDNIKIENSIHKEGLNQVSKLLEDQEQICADISKDLDRCRELLGQERETTDYLKSEVEKTQGLLSVSIVKLVKERQQQDLLRNDGK